LQRLGSGFIDVEELDGLIGAAGGERGVVPPGQVEDGGVVHVVPFLLGLKEEGGEGGREGGRG